jgi:hypothetical protein
MILYIVGFFTGIIIANHLWKEKILQDISAVYSILGKYQAVDRPPNEYFLFLFRKKSIFLGTSLVAGFIGVGEIFALLVILWLGFLAGGLSALFLLQSGIKGLLFCSLGILVQILLYIPATITFLMLISGRNRYKRRQGSMHKQEVEIQVLICFIFIISCVAGVLLETYVNPFSWLKSVI